MQNKNKTQPSTITKQVSSPALIVPTNIQPLSPPKPYPIAPLPVNIVKLTNIEVNAAAEFQNSKTLIPI